MKATISKKQLREFGFLIGFGFPFLIGWLIPTILGAEFRTWTLWIGFPGLILGITAPGQLIYPYKSWMYLGRALGLVNSHIILMLVFVLVLLPIAFIMRVFGYEPLRRRQEGEYSYREHRKGHQIELKRIF